MNLSPIPNVVGCPGLPPKAPKCRQHWVSKPDEFAAPRKKNTGHKELGQIALKPRDRRERDLERIGCVFGCPKKGQVSLIQSEYAESASSYRAAAPYPQPVIATVARGSPYELFERRIKQIRTL